MKKGLLLTIGLILLVSFLSVGTYMWYNFFLKASDSYGLESPNANGGITIIDNQQSVYETGASKVDDSDVNSVKPYTFKIKNESNQSGKYTLVLEDVPVNTINDGCTESTLLKRTDLKFQLKLNGKVLKEGLLSSIKDNILDTRTIKANTTNNYELRIFIHKNATNWIGKHYHYQVNLQKN